MINSAMMHWVTCDRCGARVEGEYGEGMVHDDQTHAVDAADDQDWHCEGGNHLCEECTPHGPDWDDEHEDFAAGQSDELDCGWCRVKSATEERVLA